MDAVNLLPDTYRTRDLWRSRAFRWAALGVSFVLLVVGYSFIIGRHVGAVKRELAPLEKQVAEKQELTQRLADLEEEVQRALEKQTALDELLDQSAWAQVLADIADAACDNAWLERMRFTKVKTRQERSPEDGAHTDAAQETEETIEVLFTAHGYANSNFDLANFMARLERSPRFGEVELNYSELTEADGKESLIQFEIKGELL
jgi:Tfp pilus assembly protein PilN